MDEKVKLRKLAIVLKSVMNHKYAWPFITWDDVEAGNQISTTEEFSRNSRYLNQQENEDTIDVVVVIIFYFYFSCDVVTPAAYSRAHVKPPTGDKIK